MRLAFLALAVSGVLLCTAATARADQVRYVGIHPITEAAGGGFCYIEGPHVHVYAPANAKLLYRKHADHYWFAGDPVAYGYEGPTATYYGHHPIPIAEIDIAPDIDSHLAQGEICYLDGAHFHWYSPPPGVKFELKGNAYWYVGEMPAVYVKQRKVYAQINAVYAPLVYVRPVVVVEPPSAWIGLHAHAGGGVGVGVAGGGGIEAGIAIDIPEPVIDVQFGVGVGGGVVVDGGGHGHGHKKVRRRSSGTRYRSGSGSRTRTRSSGGRFRW